MLVNYMARLILAALSNCRSSSIPDCSGSRNKSSETRENDACCYRLAEHRGRRPSGRAGFVRRHFGVILAERAC